MARRWYNEDYRKLYTRQDGPWLSLPACARALGSDLIRYADDKGVVAVVEPHETDAQAIAGVVHAKADEAPWIERAVSALVEDEYLVKRGRRLIIRNFVEAQERLSQDARRKRRQRDREAQEVGPPPGPRPDGGGTTPGHAPGQDRDGILDKIVTAGVTEPGHVTPHVTPHVTAMSAVSVSSRVESVTQAPPARVRSLAAPTPDALWCQGTGDLSADATGLLDLWHHVGEVAARFDRDPDKLFTDALGAYKAFRESCTNGRVPALSPRKLLEHWPTVWERINGTAPAGRAPPGNVTPIRPPAPPSADDNPLWTPEEEAQRQARKKALAEQKARSVPPPPEIRNWQPPPKRPA